MTSSLKVHLYLLVSLNHQVEDETLCLTKDYTVDRVVGQ